MSEVEQSGKKVFSARCLALYLTLNVYIGEELFRVKLFWSLDEQRFRK